LIKLQTTGGRHPQTRIDMLSGSLPELSTVTAQC